jgi:hypothetical protein
VVCIVKIFNYFWLFLGCYNLFKKAGEVIPMVVYHIYIHSICRYLPPNPFSCTEWNLYLIHVNEFKSFNVKHGYNFYKTTKQRESVTMVLTFTIASQRMRFYLHRSTSTGAVCTFTLQCFWKNNRGQSEILQCGLNGLYYSDYFLIATNSPLISELKDNTISYMYMYVCLMLGRIHAQLSQ